MTTFAELELMAPIQRALAEAGYETPTPIQAQTIPPALNGQDVLGCAQTGTGKTAAFSLPILHRLAEPKRKAIANHPFALILAPTRELAIQIGESFATYGKHLRLRQGLVYGGVSQNGQVRKLNRGVHILVATPGRLLDLMNQGFISLSQLEVLVLDEADRMLDMGFLPDLKKIFQHLPTHRQSLFFSATLAPKIVDLAKSLLIDPVNVNVTPKSRSVDLIDQRVMFVEKRGKQALLKSVISSDDVDRVLVFTRTKRGANLLSDRLVGDGFRATAIHGNKSQSARQKALEAFRSKEVRILVATDVAARGIDIDGISHVVNFDIPDDPESYVHRIGRTGRAGAEGIAISFCSHHERHDLRAIEELIGKQVPIVHGSPADVSTSGDQASPGKPRRQPNSKRGKPRRPSKAGGWQQGKKVERGLVTAGRKRYGKRRSKTNGTANGRKHVQAS